MKTNPPCILIYNPISGHGHLDSWNAMFVSFLLENGWRVLALTPDVPALMSQLAQKGVAESPRLHMLEWNALSFGFSRQALLARLRRAWVRWDAFGDQYFYRRPDSETTPNMPFLTYWRTRLYQLVVPPLFRTSHFLYARYRRRNKARTSDSASVDPEANYLDPVEFANRVKAALKKSKWKPAMVFNMYMDMYRTDAGSWIGFSALNSLPWAGIRFVPAEVPQEGYYALPSFNGMCFLDENICRTYQGNLPDKLFEYLPDITETALPDQQGELAQAIQQRAAGRKIVFLGGSIGGQKNLARWYEMIGLADPREWFFVQIGELHKGTFTREDLAAHERIMASPPENFFVKTEYLPDERSFNEIIVASDVIFAVYRDFKISSNMPCKAASFRKPILVSDRYLMGDRVIRYGIGQAVAEDSASKMLEGLLSIARNQVPYENFMRFCLEFSKEVLAERLDNFLTKCLQRKVQ